MAKAKHQPSDNVGKSKTSSQLSVEQLKNDCYELLVEMKQDGDEAKLHNTNKRETKEKLIPRLRALKSKLSRQGKKDGVDGWTTWFNENREDFGISLRTADRWIEPEPKEKLRFADIKKIDGLNINGRKFTFTLKFRHGNIVGLTLTKVVVPEKSQAIVETQPVEKSTPVRNQTTHKMSVYEKRTWCGRRSSKDMAMSDTPTCRNCQNGEQRHNDAIESLKNASEQVGYVYDETTGVASPKVTVVLNDCPTAESEGFANSEGETQ